MTATLTQNDTFTEALPGLLASPPERLPFAARLEVRAFVLQRAEGDVMLYSNSHAGRAGVARRYLNHWHEAMFAPDSPVDAPLFVHEADAPKTEEQGLRVRATFSRRHRLDEDLEVIPTPGHTPGATAYLWESGGHRFLFTGDSIYLSGEGEWRAAVLSSSDRESYVDSLDLIRNLDFDVLVPWATSAGADPHALTSSKDARRRVGAILDRVWRGGDG